MGADLEQNSTLLLGFAVLLALGAGGAMALQPAVNGRLASQCQHPLQASIISFGTGFAALVVVGAVLGIGLPVPQKLLALPIWAWFGGLLGTYMVTVSLLVAPKLGAVRWIALVLSGQIALSLVLDHFGWIGYPEQPINLYRILGVVLVVLGVFLVMKN